MQARGGGVGGSPTTSLKSLDTASAIANRARLRRGRHRLARLSAAVGRARAIVACIRKLFTISLARS